MNIINYKVRNEFIEKAIEFYSGYVSAEVYSEFLSNVITESMKEIIKIKDAVKYQRRKD